MNEPTIQLKYVNSLIYELEKAFWDERAIRWREGILTCVVPEVQS